MKEQYTYFIKNPLNGLIKIGRSEDVEKRFKSLRTGAGIALELLFYIERDVEKELHIKYNKQRKIGEWFDLTYEEVLNEHNLFGDSTSIILIKDALSGERNLNKANFHTVKVPKYITLRNDISNFFRTQLSDKGSNLSMGIDFAIDQMKPYSANPNNIRIPNTGMDMSSIVYEDDSQISALTNEDIYYNSITKQYNIEGEDIGRPIESFIPTSYSPLPGVTELSLYLHDYMYPKQVMSFFRNALSFPLEDVLPNDLLVDIVNNSGDQYYDNGKAFLCEALSEYIHKDRDTQEYIMRELLLRAPKNISISDFSLFYYALGADECWEHCE